MNELRKRASRKEREEEYSKEKEVKKQKKMKQLNIIAVLPTGQVLQKNRNKVTRI